MRTEKTTRSSPSSSRSQAPFFSRHGESRARTFVQPQRQAQAPQVQLQAGVQGAPATLAFGQVVHVEVRGSGRVEEATHEYPIDVNGKIKMPMLGLVQAQGLTLLQLGRNIEAALVSGGFLTSPTVNVTLTSKIVAYGALITQPSLHLRLLSGDGHVEPESGSYPVRSDGTLNLPYVGVVQARNRRLDTVEAQVEAGYRQSYILNAVVHLTRQSLV